MTRFAAAVFLGLVGLWAEAPAAVGPPQTPRPRAERKTQSADADFHITAATEVKLNGRACRYKDVPDNATIMSIEVDRDTRAILKVHFRTGK